ncbi:hypothetical protein [Tardiphaga sp. 862_B3_N1_1]|uniref:hypothetical protein n=1 Tax=Tardiphaga sp. 862_B3_N1_1 TaxID=3240763 RepID=UPI003F8B5BAC
MTSFRWYRGAVIAASLAMLAIGLLAFAHSFSPAPTRCYVSFISAQWPKWIGCAMAVHENLAGGLIGLSGALFGAWLAFSGTQDQLRKMNEDSRVAARLRLEIDIAQLSSDIDSLSLAAGYMTKIEEQFPEDGIDNDEFNYEWQLVGMYKKALVYLSQSAASAPYGFGRSITTVVWRLEKLAENILSPPGAPSLLRTSSDVSDEIKSCIHGLRMLIGQIEAKLPPLLARLSSLKAQAEQLR